MEDLNRTKSIVSFH